MREHDDPLEIHDFFIWLGLERTDNDNRFFLPRYETKNKIKVGKDYLISALVNVDYISLEFVIGDKYFENGCVKSIKHDDGSIELFGGYNKWAEEHLHSKILIDKYNEFKRLRKLNEIL